MDGLLMRSMSNRKNHAIREKIARHTQEQRRSLMYLVADFLRQHGFHKAWEALTEEARLTNDHRVCDNVDLEIILHEYNDYYHARFHKLPQICKRVEDNNPVGDSVKSKDLNESELSNSSEVKKKVKPARCEYERNVNEVGGGGGVGGLVVTSLSQKIFFDLESQSPEQANNGPFENEKIFRPLGNLYPAGSEWREIAEIITREIVMTNLNVHWEDIHGLKECKQLLKETIVYPTKYPELFTKLFTPCKGILIYGPPGTGKTMLAKAVATECNLTFFNITASSLVSKWRGDSEKYIRVLFELANHHAPSIIFIDEIDWIAAGDGAGVSDKSEAARRFRAELLSRLDGLVSEDDTSVILLAATNAPWNLDSALLRRLEKHVRVDVPDYSVREAMFKVYTDKRLHGTKDFDCVVEKTKGYSSADLKRLCKEAWMVQMRTIFEQLEKDSSGKLGNDFIAKAISIEDCRFIMESTSRVLCTGNNLKGKYDEWKNSLAPIN